MRTILTATLLLLVACSAGAGNEGNQIANGGEPAAPPRITLCEQGPSEADCAPMEEAERMRGVWVTGFEQSGFILNATEEPEPWDVRAQQTWLTFAAGATPDRSVWAQRDAQRGSAAFAIEFEGRRSHGPSPHGGYGHMNGAQNLVVVDRIISLRILPPRP